MASPATLPETPTPAAPLPPAAAAFDSLIPSAAVEQALGQTVRAALDLKSWNEGSALEDILTRVRDAVDRSIREEGTLHRAIRGEVLDKLRDLTDAPAAAGVYRVPDALIRDARRNVLLAGQATGCNGACAGHDGLSATVLGIGVCLVRYDGRMNSYRSTFLRHDYDAKNHDPVGRLKDVLNRRARRDAGGPADAGDALHALLRRGFMAVAERAALHEKTNTRWKIGHGTPAPMELLTGSGCMELIDVALPLLDSLLLKSDRWVFLPSTLSRRALLTLANALQPGELAVFQKGKPMVEEMIDTANYAPGYRAKVQQFAAKLGEASVVGGFRATRYAPPQLFVAHADRALEAGVLAMADAALQPHTGFPLLLTLSHIGATTGLGVDAFRGMVDTCYARARMPSMGERPA